jgi:hypothetical protein
MLSGGPKGVLRVFRVYDISTFVSQRPETIGSKEKRWLDPPSNCDLPQRPHLFKIGREGTGENWAEKVSCEIARALQIPCADYELATDGAQKGVLSGIFYPKGGSFFPGNVLLSRFSNAYDGTKQYKQIGYKLDLVLGLIRLLELGPPQGTPRLDLDALNHFIGYLLFDALIANTDRHHENWGVVRSAGEAPVLSLAPSFDHASCLGRNEPDEKRCERLRTKDKRSAVEAYTSRARSAFFGRGENILKMQELVSALLRRYPEPTKLWAKQIQELPMERLKRIFNQVPADWISEPAVEFALRMLAYNKQMIAETALGR